MDSSLFFVDVKGAKSGSASLPDASSVRSEQGGPSPPSDRSSQAKRDRQRPARGTKRRTREHHDDGQQSDDSDGPDEEERTLQAALFGSAADLLALPDTDLHLSDHEDEDDSASDASDTTPTAAAAKSGDASVWVDPADASSTISLMASQRTKKLRRNEDEDEITGAEYEARLRQHFESTGAQPKWAKENADTETDTLLRSTGALRRARAELPQGRLSIRRVTDGNKRGKSDCVLRSTKFHPTSNVLLTAGFDKTLRLFQVDGKHNAELESVFLRDLPMESAFFMPGGTEVVCTGRRRHFYVYDIQSSHAQRVKGVRGRSERSLENASCSPNGQYVCIAGNGGHVLLLSGSSKQLVGTVRCNEEVRSMTWTTDSTYLYTGCTGGQVYEWDMRMRRCVHRFADQGSLGTTAMSISPSGQYHACGSTSGVVNVYDSGALSQREQQSAKPFASLLNLSTDIGEVVWSHDSQIMAITSNRKKSAVRLVHAPSFSVFSWPRDTDYLGRVYDLDFSPHSGYMVIGNAKGQALLYRLNHYDEI